MARTTARLLALLLALALALTAVPPARAEAPGVIADSTVYPYSAVGRLNARGHGFCTGVLVAPDVVLTAAHCFHDDRRGAWRPLHEMHFVAGWRSGDFLAHSAVAEVELGLKTAPAHSLAGAGNDWALARLAEPIGETVGWLGIAPSAGSAAAEAEAGWRRVFSAAYRRDRKHAVTVAEDCAPREVATRGPRPVLLHLCDVVAGASGSPLVAERDGAFYVVGVNAMRAENTDGTARGVAATMTPVLEALGLDAPRPGRAPGR